MNEFLEYINILKRRWLPASIVFIFAFSLGCLRAFKQVPLYQAKGKLLFGQESSSPFSEAINPGIAYWANKQKLANEIVILTSKPLAKQVIAELNLQESSSILLSKLRVKNIEGTDILQLSYTDPNPEKATAILKTWMKNYIKQDKQRNLSEIFATKEFIEQQIPKSETALNLAANKLKLFKQYYQVLDITSEQSSTIKIISSLDSQIATTRTELAAQQTRLESLRNIFGITPQEALVINFISESPIASSMLQQIQELQEKIKVEKLRFGENHPQITAWKKEKEILNQEFQDYLQKILVGQEYSLIQLDKINPEDFVQPGNSQQSLLQDYEATEREIRSLQIQLETLKQLMNDYKARVDQLPDLEFQQRQLERELATQEESYTQLLKLYRETEVAINQKQGNVKEIEPVEVPKSPTISRTPMYLLQGFLGAVLLAAATAYSLEKLDQSIKTPEEVKELLNYPVRGNIPIFRKSTNGQTDTDVYVKEHSSSPVSEAFRILHTSLKFFSSDQDLQVIVITSSIPQEGKSTVAANLAAASSEAGNRVLLIDGDLRKPSQHKIWQVRNQEGLCAIAQDQAHISEVCYQVMPNVDLLVTGKIESNPTPLLNSGVVNNLINNAKKNYDLIVIDTPPLTAAADGIIFGKMADGILMVLRLGKVNSSAVRASKELLEQSQHPILGLVFNAVGEGGLYSSYYNYHYYSYGDLSKKNAKSSS